MKSLVSICIPTYNGAKFIAEAMDSAIAQTYPNLEIIVSDDASTDDTLKVIEAYRSKTNVPIHIYHHKPQGIGANWNHCILNAKGEYIKFLFQDDVLLPKAVEKMVEVLELNKKVGLVSCKREFIMSTKMNSQEMTQWISLYGDLQKHITHYKSNDAITMELNKSLFRSPTFLKSPLNKIGEPTTFMFRKSIVEKIGYFREDLMQILDYEFCYRVLKRYHIVILNETLCKFRLHEHQATQLNKGQDQNDYRIYRQIIHKHYFWYLSRKEQVLILREKYKLVAVLHRLWLKVNPR